MRHEIDIESFKDYKITHELAGNFGHGEHKSLRCIVFVESNAVIYEVLEHGELIDAFLLLYQAIRKYNSL